MIDFVLCRSLAVVACFGQSNLSRTNRRKRRIQILFHSSILLLKSALNAEVNNNIFCWILIWIFFLFSCSLSWCKGYIRWHKWRSHSNCSTLYHYWTGDSSSCWHFKDFDRFRLKFCFWACLISLFQWPFTGMGESSHFLSRVESESFWNGFESSQVIFTSFSFFCLFR